MSMETARQAIEVYLNTNFTTYPIKWENVPFSPPETTPWISCTLRRSGLPTPEINQSSYEVSGLLIFQIFTPLHSGTVDSNTIADTLAGLFSDKTISNTWFSDADVIDVGDSDTWYQVNLSIPFNYIGV